jgi:hypothetical protein
MLSLTSRYAVIRLLLAGGLTGCVLQTLAIQLGIKEAIISTGTASGATDRDFDLKKLKDVLDRCSIVITERKPSTSVLTYRYSCSPDVYRRICGKDD